MDRRRVLSSKAVARILAVFLVFGGGFIVFANVLVLVSTAGQIHTSPQTLESADLALILGAAVYGEDVSDVLRLRLDAGLNLLAQDNVEGIVLSGRVSGPDYDEVSAMHKYVLSAEPSIQSNQIWLDNSGTNTFRSLVNASATFEDRRIVIVTQTFHAARSLFLAKALEMDAVALSLDESGFSIEYRLKWCAREILARAKALLDVLF